MVTPQGEVETTMPTLFDVRIDSPVYYLLIAFGLTFAVRVE